MADSKIFSHYKERYKEKWISKNYELMKEMFKNKHKTSFLRDINYS